MLYRNSISLLTFVAALSATLTAAGAFDDAKYLDLSGQWLGVRLPVGGQPGFDPTKPWGLGQQAPLTPEYQAVLEASVADQINGGQGNWRRLPPAWHAGADDGLSSHGNRRPAGYHLRADRSRP